MGEPGTGRFSFVKRYLKAEGKRLQTPADWVYVNNFDEPREPRALELPARRRRSSRHQRLDRQPAGDLSGGVRTPVLPAEKSAIDRAFNQRYDKALDVIERLALERRRAVP
jgi:hypothetical protein